MLASALRLLVTVVAMALAVEGGYRLFLMFTGCMLRAAQSHRPFTARDSPTALRSRALA
jgi:hypothetical protein